MSKEGQLIDQVAERTPANDNIYWTEPASIAVAEEMIVDLQDAVTRIQSQLSERKSLSEWVGWRSRATRALTIKNSQLRKLKLWLKRQRILGSVDREVVPGPQDPNGLLEHSYLALKDMLSGTSVDPAYLRKLVDSLEYHLRHYKIITPNLEEGEFEWEDDVENGVGD